MDRAFEQGASCFYVVTSVSEGDGLAAHEGKLTSAHHYEGNGVYNFVPVAPSVYGSGRLLQEARSGDLWEGGGP